MALTIGADQIAMFRERRIRRFVDDMVAYIEAEYPSHFAFLGAAETRAFVERSIRTARDMGIRTAGSVGVLTELWLMYGEKLERAPDRQWARNILAHPRLPDYIKVETIQNRLSEHTGGRALFAAPPAG